jgi:flagellar motor switch protein FliM
VLLIVMEINGEVDFGALTLCVPFTALEEHIERIGSLDERKRPEPKDMEEWRNRLESNLRHVDVGLPVFLGDAEIPISELMALEREDVIVIDKRITEPVEMPVGSDAVIRGNIGVFNRRLALKVMEIRRLDAPAAEVETAHG